MTSTSGLTTRKRDDRARAAQLRQCLSDRLLKRAVALVVEPDEVRDDFRVGVRTELDALGLQLGAQFAEVLDDTVLDDDQLP